MESFEAGVKQGDNAAVCPRRKHLIFGNVDETTIQSRDHCFPYIMAMCRETKKSIEWMWPRLEQLEALGKEGANWWEDYKPLQVVHNSDLSLMWKYRERGGAAKVKKFFCHCCTLKSDNIVTPNNEKCLKWCDPESDLPCYHQTFADNTNLEEYRRLHEQLGDILAQRMQPLADIRQRTRLNVNEDPRRPTHDARKSIDSIHYELWRDSVSDEQKRQYARKLAYDLILRGMPVPELLVDQQQSLQQAFIMEHQYWNLGEALAECDEERANIIALINNVPCILHLENRTGLKIFTSVVQKGLSRALYGDIFPHIHDDARCFDAFFSELNRIVCTKILGSMENPSQWECPCDRSKRELGIICLDNNKTRKVVNGLDLIIDFCIAPTEQSKWKDCIANYRQAMNLLRKRTDLSNNEVKMFQQHVDAFFVAWLDLVSREGVTNYIHMLGAGHIGEYLLHHRNLYKHSQQGWEAFNALLKTFFFRRTGRGGAGNRGTGIRSKIIPIARWLSRRVLWLMGYDYDRVIQELNAYSDDNNSDNDNNDSDEENFSDDNILVDESDDYGTI